MSRVKSFARWFVRSSAQLSASIAEISVRPKVSIQTPRSIRRCKQRTMMMMIECDGLKAALNIVPEDFRCKTNRISLIVCTIWYRAQNKYNSFSNKTANGYRSNRFGPVRFLQRVDWAQQVFSGLQFWRQWARIKRSGIIRRQVSSSATSGLWWR